MGRKLVIFGAKSTALEISEVAHSLERWTEIIRIKGDLEDYQENGVYDRDYAKQIAIDPEGCDYILSMAKQRFRAEWLQFANELGLTPVNVISKLAYISPTAEIGTGIYLAPHASLSSRVKVQDHVIINFNATVGHDTVVESHVSINPGANVGGNVHIGERTLIGANSFIFQGTKIGADCTIDALTYLDRDLAPGMLASSRNVRITERKKRG